MWTKWQIRCRKVFGRHGRKSSSQSLTPEPAKNVAESLPRRFVSLPRGPTVPPPSPAALPLNAVRLLPHPETLPLATAPGKLADYAISHNRHFKFHSSRSLLEQTAASILLKLNGDPKATPPVPPDVLPGMDAAKIAALQQAAADYQGVKGDQTGAQSGASTARHQLELAMNGIVAQRREIQFAADADWPHEDPANAAIRVEFQLPADHVMK